MSLSAKAKKTLSAIGTSPKFGDIKKIGKEIKVDHELAQELWSQGEYFPRLLATLIFDKKQLAEKDIKGLAKDIAKHKKDERDQLGDWLLANQLTKDKKLITLMESWQQDSSSVLQRWYWYYQARQRWTGRIPPEGSSSLLLDKLEADMAIADPDVQWAMNFCAGWIGIFEPELRSRCVKLGKKLELYKDEPVAKNCTPNYLPEFISIEVAKRNL